MAQSVLRDVRSHLIGSLNTEPFGFLLGHVVYCPWTRAPYVVIDAVRRETQDAPHSGNLDSFRRAWASASREARRRRGQIIGWYHQHGVLGLRLSQSDLQLQEEFQKTGRASLYRKGISGFYELVDLDARLIDGKKPSVVDWTNHRAEERVEILPAKWPVPRRRPPPTPDVKRGDRDESQPEVERDEETATASKAQPGLTAQRWKKRTSPATKQPTAKKSPAGKAKSTRKKKRPSKAKPVAKKTTGSAKAEPAPSLEPTPDEQAAATTGDLTGEFHDVVGRIEPEPDEAPAGAGPARSPLDVDDGQVAEFLEAVWGPPPFEPEENDEPILELPLHLEIMPTEAPELQPTPEVAETPTAIMAVTGPFGAEPSEGDSGAGSLEWLLGLVEETLSAGLASADEAAEAAEEQAAEEAKEQAAEEALETKKHSAEPEDVAAGAEEETEFVAAEARRGKVVDPPADQLSPIEPGLPARGTRPVVSGVQGRSAFVGLSTDPDEDPEAEIPVVMPTEDGLVRFPMLRRRRDRALIAAAMAIAAVSAWFFLGREDPPQPAFRTPGSVTTPAVRAPAQAPEFNRLSGEFTAALAAYGERRADFQLGRIDCAGLTTGYDALAASFSALSEYVALTPSGSVDFQPLAEDMREARAGFQASGCGGGPSPTAGPAP